MPEQAINIEQSPEEAEDFLPEQQSAPDPDGAQQSEAGAKDQHESETALERLRREVEELKEQALRSAAEAENVRRRAQRDIEENAKYALSSFARSLVEAVENFYRATDSISDEAKNESDVVKNLATGVEMTLRELVSVMERNGIRRIHPLGEKFDHNFHQAIAQIDDPSKEPGTIVQVIQAGYALHERLLRPALVGVSKLPQEGSAVDTQA